MLAFLFTKTGKYLALAAGGIALLGSVFLFGYQSAEKDNRSEALKAKVRTLETIKDVEDELEELEPDERLRRLDGWMRDDAD